jgi:hypothetical protein
MPWWVRFSGKGWKEISRITLAHGLHLIGKGNTEPAEQARLSHSVLYPVAQRIQDPARAGRSGSEVKP